MAAVDHGPQAPSIAIARMAATCGVGLNNAMASAINVLGDVHGGAGEQAWSCTSRSPPASTPARPSTTPSKAEIAALAASGHQACPRLRPSLPSGRSARAAAARAGRAAAAAGTRRRPLRRDRPRGRARAGQRRRRQAHPDEHRRRHRRDLRRARLPAAALPRPVRAVALGRHPGPRLGADAAGRPQQGPDPPRAILWTYRGRRACATWRMLPAARTIGEHGSGYRC